LWIFLCNVTYYVCCASDWNSGDADKGRVGTGQKKLSKVIVPDKWKEGASNTTEGGGRKLNENKLLSKKHRCLLALFSRILDQDYDSEFASFCQESGQSPRCLHLFSTLE